MTAPNNTSSKKVERAARLRWVPIEKMRVSPVSQRDLRQPRVDHLAANFDLEQLGTPTVNLRDDWYWIIDGQHRIAALQQIGWGDQQVQCWTYEGLSETEEAERFLKLADTLTPSAYDRFRIGVNAGRDVECDIDRVVRANGCVVSLDDLPGAIRAVGTIRRVYDRSGPDTLGRTVRIVREAYGDPGMDAAVIDGIGHLCQRYNGVLDETTAITKLSRVSGGVNGLLGRAEIIRRKTGNPKGQSVAAAAVDLINTGKGGKKLSSWWAE